MAGGDVQLAQPGAAKDRHDVARQLPERGADATDKQSDHRQQHQRGATEAGQQDRDLIEAAITDAQ
ncbi:hypothetical protein D3C78_1615490 [compost metagenome]